MQALVGPDRELIRLLGKGSVAHVYLAREAALDDEERGSEPGIAEAHRGRVALTV